MSGPALPGRGQVFRPGLEGRWGTWGGPWKLLQIQIQEGTGIRALPILDREEDQDPGSYEGEGGKVPGSFLCQGGPVK